MKFKAVFSVVAILITPMSPAHAVELPTITDEVILVASSPPRFYPFKPVDSQCLWLRTSSRNYLFYSEITAEAYTNSLPCDTDHGPRVKTSHLHVSGLRSNGTRFFKDCGDADSCFFHERNAGKGAPVLTCAAAYADIPMVPPPGKVFPPDLPQPFDPTVVKNPTNAYGCN